MPLFDSKFIGSLPMDAAYQAAKVNRTYEQYKTYSASVAMEMRKLLKYAVFTRMHQSEDYRERLAGVTDGLRGTLRMCADTSMAPADLTAALVDACWTGDHFCTSDTEARDVNHDAWCTEQFIRAIYAHDTEQAAACQ